MRTTKEYLDILRDYKADKAVKYDIVGIGIFGSTARGEQTKDSDVDIYVDLGTPDIFNMVHIKEDLENLFGCTVDIVRIRDELDAMLRKNIMEEGIYA